MKRPRAVVLGFEWPLPADSGWKARCQQVLALLAQRYDVDFFAFAEDASQIQHIQSERFGAGKLCATLVPGWVRIRSRPLTLFSTCTRAILRGEPYIVAKFHSSALRRVLEQRMQAGAELLVCGHPSLLPYFRPYLNRAPLLLEAHNVEYTLWLAQAKSSSKLVAPLVRWEAGRLAEYERVVWRQAQAIIAIAQEDAALIRTVVTPSTPVSVLAPLPSLNPNDAKMSGRTPPVLGLLGNWGWPPNREGLSHGMPQILRRCPGGRLPARCRIAGPGLPRRLARSLAARGIEVLGYVADASHFLAEVDLVLAPYRVPCGVRIKLLDAMATGKALVTTRAAAHGIASELQHHLPLHEDWATFTADLVTLCTDQSAHARRVQAGQSYLRSHHVPELANKSFESLLADLSKTTGCRHRSGASLPSGL